MQVKHSDLSAHGYTSAWIVPSVHPSAVNVQCSKGVLGIRSMETVARRRAVASVSGRVAGGERESDEQMSLSDAGN